jgi:hypothetical protein
MSISRPVSKYSISQKETEKGCSVKKSIYAVSGALMITVAEASKALASGSLELAVLIVIGIELLIASAGIQTQGHHA